MKALLILLLLPLFIIVASPRQALAGPFDEVCASYSGPAAEAPSVCASKDNNEDPLTGSGGVILKTARLLAFLTGMASIIIILIGSIKYITANGDSNSVNSAKNTILYAMVGLVISLLAQGIIVFVINRIR